jgi:hypothetical protein
MSAWLRARSCRDVKKTFTILVETGLTAHRIGA